MLVAGMVAVAGVIAAIVIALGVGSREPADVVVDNAVASASADAAPGSDDPLAWNPDRKAEFVAGATLGESHVLYEKSPGGVINSAAVTSKWRADIERAATAHGVNADLLEAVIFLESAGRPDVMAGPTPDSASGLAQILPSTATDLLGMKVDLPTSIALTKAIDVAAKKGKDAIVTKLEAKRRSIDDRFVPSNAIDGAAKYLEIAGERFGSPELAIVSYHMGIGNLEQVITDFTGQPTGETSTKQLVADDGISYPELFFDSSPTRHPKAWKLLSSLGDDSSTYLWRVYAAREIMQRWRQDRTGLEQTATLATNKATLEEVFHPEDQTRVFENPGDIQSALDGGYLLPLASDEDAGFNVADQMGELAPKLHESPELYRALRPQSLAALSYIAAKVKAISGDDQPLKVTSSVRDRSYQDLLIGVNSEATTEYSLHTTGYAFDILRNYGSNAQASAFQFVLDRLRAVGLIDYAVEPAAIHITAANNASVLAP